MNPTIQAIDAILLHLEAIKALEQNVPIPAYDSTRQMFIAMMAQGRDNLIMFWQLYRKVTPNDV